MKKIYLFITVLMFSATSLLQAQTKTYLSNAVNIAGKQRMLGQRMAKNKVFLAANQKKSFATKELQKTIAGFEKGLKILQDFAPNNAVKHKVDIQEYVFNKYKTAILSKSKESLKEVLATNTLFLAVCDDVVTELINYSYSKALKADGVNKHQKYVIDKIAAATGASGKLRYLTQRLTLYFSINEFGYQKVTPLELDQIIKTMDANLGYLTVLEFNTLDIDDSLSEVQYYWNQLKGFLYNEKGEVNMKPKKINALSLYDLCNTILAKANATTKMYADLNKQ